MKQKILLLTLTVLCAAAPVFAQGNSSMPSFAPEIKRVAVFKNGYAFTYREGETRTANGWAYTTRIPVGVLGTVWGYTTAPNSRITRLLASEGERDEAERVTNLVEFLLANEGAQVRINTNFSEKEKPLTGTYQILKPSDEDIRLAQLRSGNQYGYGYSLNYINELTIALKTANGMMTFPAQQIQTVEVVGEAKTSLMKKSNRLAMKVEGAKDGQAVGVGIAALERGIRWIPAYRVEVKGEPIKEAKLELEAMLINELTDLQNSEVYFVVGVPSFIFQDAMSPLSMNTAFAGVSSYFQTGGAARSGERRDAYSNAIQSQVAISGRQTELLPLLSEADDATPTVSTEERSPSLSAEQLFLYKADQIALKKGERMSLRLFSLTVPCSEVFEWTIADPPNTEQRYLNSSYSSGQSRLPSLEDLSSRIWYALKLKNQTGMPWTTAPALSFREWKPMGQNLLSFTPVDGENILRVTPATEVVGSHKLEEKERVRQELRYSGSTYEFDLVTIEGTVKLRNIKKQPVEVVLTRNVVGEVMTANENGAISREGLNLQAVNPNSIVKWNLTVPPGEKEIRYTYKVYVRK
jgi:hypothetical protein